MEPSDWGVTAVLLALLTALLFGVAGYMGPVLSRSHGPSAVLAVGQVGAVAAAAVYLLAVGDNAPDARSLVLGVLAGAANGLALTSMFEAARYLPISIMAPIGATGGTVPVVVALLLGERPHVLQLVGIPLAIVGVVLVAARRSTGTEAGAPPAPPAAGVHLTAGARPTKGVLQLTGARSATGSLQPGAAPQTGAARPTGGGSSTTGAPRRVGLRLAASWALCYGAFLSLFAEASKGGREWAVFDSRVALLVTAVALPLLRGTSLRLAWNAVPLVAVNGLLILGGVIAYGLATAAGLVSVVSVLATLSPVVTVALAVVILRERLARWQQVGLVATVVGVVLLAAG